MDKTPLPPLLAEINNGSVTWKRLDSINYEVLGYFLSCHLIIEHYLDEFLKICHPALDWEASRQTFGQKISLLSNFKISDQYDCIPAIKHMNSLRNKLSHNIEFKIEANDLLPLRQYLDKATEGRMDIPHDPKGLLEQFTMMTCVLFAGYISSEVHHKKLTRK
ncbi:hypothetical protein [Pseudogulbenkiania sp. MAI-1]|uniref:hypothetical protein n=1 Tax=Pseudogulbenkiania sp. MAI-1 TaxID=990370 RepID=UPI0009FE5A4D|nr:hypothetical protein [Pseudogulbenkiania sp. MAI-1]